MSSQALDEAKAAASPDAFSVLRNEIQAAVAQMQADVAALIDDQNDVDAAVVKVREWMFLDKLSSEIQTAQYELADRNQ